MTTPRFASHIAAIPDFPQKGILFRDVTPVLADPDAFHECIMLLTERLHAWRNPVHMVAGIESRGFIFGTPLAAEAGVGFVPVRKPGRLPRATIRESYQKEYGPDALELHQQDIAPGTRVLVVDDLLATGGTAEAAARLVQRAGGQLAGFLFVIELDGLGGRARLEKLGPVETLLHY